MGKHKHICMYAGHKILMAGNVLTVSNDVGAAGKLVKVEINNFPLDKKAAGHDIRQLKRSDLYGG
ncbi:hypothetical protein [Chitinophaga rhizophila]|uniref:Uncharacterized protein n=1 Tax=Chitinophaga rhizophila TaxID=2866212 RepID=A0ABS7GCC2_9BACT|nr:hypothetical protein [Chitinophaga rhizophila]MBW8685330.1 hypothetical protein [Chitinophaga rhizophila]